MPSGHTAVDAQAGMKPCIATLRPGGAEPRQAEHGKADADAVWLHRGKPSGAALIWGPGTGGRVGKQLLIGPRFLLLGMTKMF